MKWLKAVAVAGVFLGGCSAAPAPEIEGPSPDAEDAAIPAPGKADSPFSACQVSAALLWASNPAVGVSELRAGGVHSSAAKSIAKAKAGPDGALGTNDDVAFRSLAELDALKWVGPTALAKLAAHAASRCQKHPEPSSSAIFSPQPTRDTSHLARAAELIDAAEHSIDIAMYSFSDSGILDALGRAKQRGVSVRFIYEPARDENKNPAGTQSAKIEAAGIDVRFVNKIMHHKFMIVDGPRQDAESALDATLLSGSANWSNSAATRYDENTVELSGVPALVLRFQREFNLLWQTSRDFSSTSAFQQQPSLPIADWMLLDDDHVDASFTSANFKVFDSALGPGFSVVAGENAVADVLIGLIQAAQSSIWIASGHLRSRPVSEALLAKHAERPDLDIRVYLDGQEYVAAGTSAIEKKDLDTCVAAAGSSESKRQACYDKDFHWSYPVTQAGIPLRFKHYAYRWHFSYAPQMHHKYFLVDGKVLASGSYNLSDNAEHQTMENMVVYRGGPFAGMIEGFGANYEAIWVTAEAEGKYDALLNEVQNGTGDVPIVYDPMALDFQQVTTLKAAIRDACPDVDSQDFREHPEKHFFCKRAP